MTEVGWSSIKLIPFEKNFYIEHPDVKKRTQAESEAWRRNANITVKGRNVPNPVFDFIEASMPEYVLEEVLRHKFQKRK